MIHELKILMPYYEAVKSGEKNFEIRMNDRGFQKGDKILLKAIYENGILTCHVPIEKEITYVHSGLGMKEGYVCLAIK